MCIEMQLLAKNAKQEKKPYYLNKINFEFDCLAYFILYYFL